MLHVVSTGVGCYIGYKVHMYEENSEERTRILLERYKHAPKLWAAQLPRDDDDDDDDDDEDGEPHSNLDDSIVDDFLIFVFVD